VSTPRMTPGEAGRLLGLMALADNRKPPDEDDEDGRAAMIAFWLEMIGDLSYADCAQAVHDHYRESRDWLMPADIRRRVAEMRQERLRENPPPPPPPELLDDPEAYNRHLRESARRIADGKPDLRMIGGAS